MKPKPEAHPHHQAVISAWCDAYRAATGSYYGAADSHRPDPREIGMLTRLRDDRVSRDPERGARDVEALRGAFRRFMQRGPFVRPSGPSTVRAFCNDPAGWFAATTTPAAKQAPVPFIRPRPMSLDDLLTQDDEGASHPHPDAIDAVWRSA